MTLDAKLEALLFYRAEPTSRGELIKWLNSNDTEFDQAVLLLKEKLANRGLILSELNGEYSLLTSPEISSLIEDLAKEELAKELGRAGLETLTIIAYYGPLSRAEIDQIRGVNSSFILRHLLVRGLIERITDKQDSRRYLYQPTFELLRYLGLESINQLPEFEIVQAELKKFLDQDQVNDKDGNQNT